MQLENDECFCGSRRQYKDCCKLKPVYSFDYHSFEQWVGECRSAYHKYKENCLFCGKPPISSHTIQNNGILDSLAVKGHLFRAQFDLTADTTYYQKFSQIGRNDTTTFHCLCQLHDTAVFRNIETIIYAGTAEQKFLFSLKAIMHEYWKSQADVKFWNDKVISKYDLLKTLQKYPESEEMFKTSIAKVDDNVRLKKYLNKYLEVLKSGKFDALTHFCQTLDYEISFACSTVIYMSNDCSGNPINKQPFYSCKMPSDEQYPICTINCFPQNGKSYIIISWFNDSRHNAHYSKALGEMLSISNNYIEPIKVLNILLPCISEEIYLSPRLVELWSLQQKKEYLSFTGVAGLNLEQHNGIDYHEYAKQISYNMFEKIEKFE